MSPASAIASVFVRHQPLIHIHFSQSLSWKVSIHFKGSFAYALTTSEAWLGYVDDVVGCMKSESRSRDASLNNAS